MNEMTEKPRPPTTAPPDLQEWVARYGGYWRIPWPLWDKAIADARQARRDALLDDLDAQRQRKPGHFLDDPGRPR